jgi:hypothetical protein
METTTPAFDATRPVAINLRTPEGLKSIRVRFPSDAEWTERQRRRKVIIKQLGRGVSETTVANAEDGDAALLARIQEKPRDGEEPAVDPFEASRIIDQLSQAEVDDVVQTGDAFRVSTRVLGGVTSHILKMPSAKDIFEHRRSFARILDLPFNRQELTINLAAAGALYKRLSQGAEGYAGEVPIIHQAVAVKAAIDALEAGFQEDRDPNF